MFKVFMKLFLFEKLTKGEFTMTLIESPFFIGDVGTTNKKIPKLILS